jgi:hypothetical protein
MVECSANEELLDGVVLQTPAITRKMSREQALAAGANRLRQCPPAAASRAHWLVLHISTCRVGHTEEVAEEVHELLVGELIPVGREGIHPSARHWVSKHLLIGGADRVASRQTAHVMPENK